MKTNYEMPQAFVAVCKNRQKIYGANTIYLADKQEFGFEFFNATSDNLMVRISINGKPISTQGLVLRPGVHDYLERYIDEDRKFLFETYTVDGDSEAVKKAIQENGDIRIEFFREKQNPRPTHTPYIWNNLRVKGHQGYHGSGNVLYSKSLGDTAGYHMNMMDMNSEVRCSSDSIDFAPEENARGFAGSLSKSKKIETGRVEKGSASGQKFTYVDMEFEYLPFHTIVYKLMPISQKPIELGELKLKCSMCGANIKNSGWKVCPFCGEPIKKENFCTNCGTKLESTTWEFCPKCGASLK